MAGRALIVSPWCSDSDWTHLLISHFDGIIQDLGYHAEVIVGRQGPAVQNASRFDWLKPKMDVNSLVHSHLQSQAIPDFVLVIDPNYLNIRALRTMLGPKVKIATLVNGGAFQPYDLETQFVGSYVDSIRAYELGFFTLCDAVLVPTHHCHSMFVDAYPSLSKRVQVIPYPLKKVNELDVPFSRKQSFIFPSRNSFEKGYDLIEAAIAQGTPIDCLSGLPFEEYAKRVCQALAVVLPARAEIFGYCAAEAIQFGTIPLLPKGLSYPEFIDLPADIFLTHPVGNKTPEEVKLKLDLVRSLSSHEYAAIIARARRSLYEHYNQPEKLTKIMRQIVHGNG